MAVPLETKLTLDASDYEHGINKARSITDEFAHHSQQQLSRRIFHTFGILGALEFAKSIVESRKEIDGLSDESLSALDKVANGASNAVNAVKLLGAEFLASKLSWGGFAKALSPITDLFPDAGDPKKTEETISKMEAKLHSNENRNKARDDQEENKELAHEEHLKQLRAKLNDADFESRLKTMTVEEKILALTEKRAALSTQMNSPTEETALERQLKAIELTNAINELSEPRGHHASIGRIQSDALARIGGFVGSGPDRPSQILSKQLERLTNIDRKTPEPGAADPQM